MQSLHFYFASSWHDLVVAITCVYKYTAGEVYIHGETFYKIWDCMGMTRCIYTISMNHPSKAVTCYSVRIYIYGTYRKSFPIGAYGKSFPTVLNFLSLLQCHLISFALWLCSIDGPQLSLLDVEYLVIGCRWLMKLYLTNENQNIDAPVVDYTIRLWRAQIISWTKLINNFWVAIPCPFSRFLFNLFWVLTLNYKLPTITWRKLAAGLLNCIQIRKLFWKIIYVP